MKESKRYKIGFYLTWCGADATQSFDTFEQYHKARTFLDKLVKARQSSEKSFGDSFDNFYIIASDQRDEFERFMASLH